MGYFSYCVKLFISYLPQRHQNLWEWERKAGPQGKCGERLRKGLRPGKEGKKEGVQRWERQAGRNEGQMAKGWEGNDGMQGRVEVEGSAGTGKEGNGTRKTREKGNGEQGCMGVLYCTIAVMERAH